ncbi:MAG: class I SAM-dependent methyltransferase [Candidatus Paceibacterota bacterium]
MSLFSPWLRRKRFAKVKPFIEGDVLDMGCGPAEILAETDVVVRSYFGIDHSANVVVANRQRFPEHQFRVADVDDDCFDIDGKFDRILMIALVEHVYNLKHLFKQACGLLKPDGKVIITTPTPFGNDLVHRIGAKLGLFAQSAADDHICVFNRKRFQILARDFDLRIEKYRTFELGCNQLVVLSRERHARHAATTETSGECVRPSCHS